MKDSIWLVDVEDQDGREIIRSDAAQGLEVRRGTAEEPPEDTDGFPVIVVLAAGSSSTESIRRVRFLRKATASSPVVVVGRGLDVDHAVALARAGVADIVSLPCTDLGDRVIASRRAGISGSGSSILVGETPQMRNVRKRIASAALHDSTVLLTGETGTGKGVAARLIHDLSPVARKRLVHTDCASLSATVIESELFGHERGAFTNATHRRTGRFEAAGGGTVFLDEIAELDLSLQSKLLRVLQDREFERVGGERTISMDARVIVATNRVLSDEVSEGRFRPDLYFRLGVFDIEIPPLRERLDDIPLLVEHGLVGLSERLQVVSPEPTAAFLAALRRRPWPGNVRELFNVLERAMVSGIEGELTPEHAEAEVSRARHPRCPADRGDSQQEFELESELAVVLRGTGGNVSRAARRLGVSRTTLQYRIRKLGLQRLIPRD